MLSGLNKTTPNDSCFNHNYPMRRFVLACCFSFCAGAFVDAQPALMLDTLFPQQQTLTGHDSIARSLPRFDGFTLFDPVLWTTVNSELPWHVEDRLMAPAAGFSQYAIGGVGYSNSFLDVILLPEFFWSTNAAYPIRAAAFGDATYGNYAANIDSPQRFGNDPLVTPWFGQSSVLVHRWGVAAWFATQNFSFGPGIRTHLVMSDAAQGFPHVAIGSYRPFETRIGDFDGMLSWGRVSESDYFDDDSTNDGRLHVAGSFSYSPSFLPGLSLSLHRAIISPWSSVSLYDAFQMFETLFKENRRSFENTPTGDDDTDQVISIAAEFTFRNPNFRVFLEYGRNDHAATAYDLTMNPEHTRGYVAGFDYTSPLSERDSIRVLGEIAVINRTPTDAVRPAAPWYRHGPVSQGYTNDGQYLGAFFGPGGNSQYFQVEWHRDSWKVAGFVERTVFDNDFFYELAENDPEFLFYDFNLVVATGLSFEIALGAHHVQAGYRAAFHQNWLWLQEEDHLNHTVTLGYRYAIQPHDSRDR